MKKFLFVLIALFFAGIAEATLPAYESITVADTAIGFTASIVASNPVTMVTCTLETAQVRFRVDGTDPTSTTGHPLETGQWICIGKCTGTGGMPSLQQISNFKAIRTGGSSGVLTCTYE